MVRSLSCAAYALFARAGSVLAIPPGIPDNGDEGGIRYPCNTLMYIRLWFVLSSGGSRLVPCSRL